MNWAGMRRSTRCDLFSTHFSASSPTPVLSFKRTIVFYAPHCFHFSLTESRQMRTKETSCSVTRNLSSSNTLKNTLNRLNGGEIIMIKNWAYIRFSWRSQWRLWNKSEGRQHLELVLLSVYKLQIETKSMQFVNMNGSIPCLNNIA